MDNATTIIGDMKIDRAAMVRLYTERINGKVTTVINGHEVNLVKALKIFKWNSSALINEAVDMELQNFAKEAYRVTAGELIPFASDTSAHTTGVLSKGFKGYFEPEVLPRSVSAEIVLKNPIYKNTTLAAGWDGVAEAERKRIEHVIRRGIADRLPEDKIIREVQNTFKLTRSQSAGLVVTATTSVYSQADHAVYAANAQSLRGWQYVAVLDSRTTPLCAHRDGTVYPTSDTRHLPPAHWHCRSTTVPVVRHWKDLASLDSVQATRNRNLTGLTPSQVEAYDLEAFRHFDGAAFEKVSYNEWLLRQPTEVQLKHLGDYTRVKMLQSGELTVDKFVSDKGVSLGLRELREATGDLAGGYNGSVEGTSRVFTNAKERLDAIRLGATTPEEILGDKTIRAALLEYYRLQSGELNGTLSVTNYRGILPHTKKATKSRVLNSPPTDEQLLYNPLTKRREDSRIYQPNKAVDARAVKLVSESKHLTEADKKFILEFKQEIMHSVGMNEAAVVTDNLRIAFERFRKNGEPWGNLKAVLNAQMKNDVTNISEYIETQLRNNSDFFYKIKQQAFLDPVLGPVQIEDLAKGFLANIKARNRWEDSVAPSIGRQLRPWVDASVIPPKLWVRLDEGSKREFFKKFAMRLAADDSPDRDQLAIGLGRDLYNAANYRGTKSQWYDLGLKVLDQAQKSGFYELETFGVKKRRMRSRMSGQYFGQYYDTFSVNLRILDPRIKEYSNLNRAVDVGFRMGVNDLHGNVLKVRPGYKTYFTESNYDTRIPVTSISGFKDFRPDFVDDNLANALNWASQTKYKVDPDMHDFVEKLLHFMDDKGQAKHFDALNHYRKYITARGDAYERFKLMKYYRERDMEFGSTAFVDHRGRIYDSGYISPQSGETFRPFLSTNTSKVLGREGYENFQDQVGSFLGGLSDKFEGRFNGLSNTGRQKIAEYWRKDLVTLGNHIARAKPGDIRAVLEMDIVQMVEGEEQGKLFRLALEAAKIDRHLEGRYNDLSKLNSYRTALALEQDASSSGAQIIALTTKNKQLAELSNVVPTHQKRRLYDEIASATFQDPAFKKLNERLGLTEKDLRKAAKAHNMVTFYGAGMKTAVINVENKLSKILGKNSGTLVVRASERNEVLAQISARAAKVARWDPDAAEDLQQLRKEVKEVFDKGLQPGDELMDQMWFLDQRSKDVVEKMTRQYDEVVTPNDFAVIGKLMSHHMEAQVPILSDFTRFFGRLAEDYLSKAKSKEARFDWSTIAKQNALGAYKGGAKLHPRLAEVLGVSANTPVSEALLKRIPGYRPDSTIAELLYGVKDSTEYRTGKKFKVELSAGAMKVKLASFEVLNPNALPKNYTQVPWVNFDGKILEQKYTQKFEEKLMYRDKDGNWVTNIIQVDQKTDPTWWEELMNEDNTMNDVVDLTGARTAYAVNGNHSNDATLVKNFHLWGKSQGVGTSTIHDAFFTNAADMVKAKAALRNMYADAVERNSIKQTLDLMRDRGLPKDIYDKYLEEAIMKGLIPVPGKSVIGGKVLTIDDILKRSDIIQPIPEGFNNDLGFYGLGG